jgi:hypothetical protein
MFNTVTVDPYIAPPTISHFKWGWDVNHWVPWMLHYPLRTHRKNHPMHKLKPTKPPCSLNESNTSINIFRIFYISSMPSTRSTMINTRCHTSFSWEIKFGCICRKNALHDPIRRFIHSTMELIPSPRLLVIMLLSSTFPPSLACT